MTTYENLEQLAKQRYWYDREDESVKAFEAWIDRRTYKSTTCGAWMRYIEPVSHPQKQGGVMVGSIVEGVEECAVHISLYFPFTDEQLSDAIQNVEDQCKDIWNETHGCDDCGDPEEYNNGHIAINLDCKTCEGEGVVI